MKIIISKKVLSFVAVSFLGALVFNLGAAYAQQVVNPSNNAGGNSNENTEEDNTPTLKDDPSSSVEKRNLNDGDSNNESPGNSGRNVPGNANNENNNLKNQGENQENRIQIQEKQEDASGRGVDNKGKQINSSKETLNKAHQKIEEKISQSKGNKSGLHKSISNEVAQRLQQAAQGESEKIQNRINQVAKQQQEEGEDTSRAIEKVEKRKGVAEFIIGSDYKNLGQLRSSLVRNENQIRQLTQTLSQMEDEENKQIVQDQIALLMEEREEMKNFIQENEEGFSLFGWAFRMINGYEKDAIVDQEKEQGLREEVLRALKEEAQVEAKEEFENKIVYEENQDTSLLAKDCEEKGGAFDECGSGCEPGADVCATVCVPVCDLENE
ncbi:MAG: hypothetical protein R6V40_02625 [Candidatus Moraniibacteriota bacterium]